MPWSKPVAIGRGGKSVSDDQAELIKKDGLSTREICHPFDMLVTGMSCSDVVADKAELARCRDHRGATGLADYIR